MRSVFLRDVARAAGVSVGAASQAVNGTGTISKATRERILGIAEKMGYRRDPALSAIASRRFHGGSGFAQVALLNITTDPESGRRLVFFEPSLIAHKARHLGLEVLPLVNLTTVETARSHVRQMYHRGVAGVLFGNINLPDVMRACDWGAFTLLGVGDAPLRLKISRVEPDWGQAVRDCCRKLSDAGCRRIGLLTYASNPISQHDRQRVGAYYADRWESGQKALAPCTEQSREGVLAWFRKNRPDGLVVFGLPLIHGLIESGVRVPDDVLVAMAQKIIRPENEVWTARFAGVRFDREALGGQALEVFFSMHTHRERGLADYPRVTRLHMAWEPGPSCPE